MAATEAVAAAEPDLTPIIAEVEKAFKGAADFQFGRDRTDGVTPLQMRRPVFTKTHGCVPATFELDRATIQDPQMQFGIFDLKTRGMKLQYPAWIRFSNDGSPGRDDVFNGEAGKNPNRGMAIKLVGVPGRKLLEGEENAQTQDFVMQNHPVFFADDAKEFLELIRDPDFRKKRKERDDIMSAMERRVVANPLHTQYWTPTPYQFGPGKTFKYFVTPVPCTSAPEPQTPNPLVEADFLRINLANRLRAGAACFDFFGQFFVDDIRTPNDRATVRWEETVAKPRRLARITIQQQPGDRIASRALRCETLSFNGWHAIEAHRPAGSLNAIRKIVYQNLARHRRNSPVNRFDSRLVAEPTQILPTE